MHISDALFFNSCQLIIQYLLIFMTKQLVMTIIIEKPIKKAMNFYQQTACASIYTIIFSCHFTDGNVRIKLS